MKPYLGISITGEFTSNYSISKEDLMIGDFMKIFTTIIIELLNWLIDVDNAKLRTQLEQSHIITLDYRRLQIYLLYHLGKFNIIQIMFVIENDEDCEILIMIIFSDIEVFI